MIQSLNRPRTEAAAELRELLAELGARRVMAAALAAMIAPRWMHRARPPDVAMLDDRLRRDIGLSPASARARDVAPRLALHLPRPPV